MPHAFVVRIVSAAILLLGSVAPGQFLGYFDGAHAGVFEGWVFDTANPTAQTYIHFYESPPGPSTYIGTTPGRTVSRPDVLAVHPFIGSDMVGFAMASPHWDSVHTVHAFVSSTPTPSTANELTLSPLTRHFGLELVGAQAAWGVVEFLDECGASGWACDADYNGPVDLEFWIQLEHPVHGPGHGPSVLLGTAHAAYPRWDGPGFPCPPASTASNHFPFNGFNVQWERRPPPGTHNIWVRAKDMNGTGFDRVLAEFLPNFGNFITFTSNPVCTPPPSNLAATSFSAETRGIASVDIDGDGTFEVAYGHPTENKVRIYDDANPGNLLATINGPAGSVEFGWSLDAADQDGDGDEELLVGDRSWGGEKGRVCIYDFSGTTPVLDGCTTFGCSCPGHWMGFDVAALGDVDGDGFGEFVTGAPRNESEAANFGGFIRIFEGTTVRHHLTAPGDPAKNRYGWAVTRLKDINGNGLPEFAVGAPFFQGERVYTGETGAVYIYEWNGTVATLLATISAPSAIDAGFGFSIAALEDMNGDGYRDYAVGAPYSGITGWSESANGRAYLFAGGASLGATTFGPVLEGGAGDQLGALVANAGDLDGDGLGDMIVSTMASASIASSISVTPVVSTSAATPTVLSATVLPDFGAFTIRTPRGESNGELLVGGWNTVFALTKFAHGTIAGATTPPVPNGNGHRHGFGLFSLIPVAPSNVDATDTLTDRITVSWNPLVGVGGYHVYRDGALVATVAGAGVSSHDDFPPTGTYSYTVAAFNGNGVGAQSAADPGTRIGPPAAVMSLNATDTLTDRVTLTWSTVPNATGYRLYRNGLLFHTVGSGNVGMHDDFAPIGTFEYTVIAYNTHGDSAGSAPDTGTRFHAFVKHLATHDTSGIFLVDMVVDAAGRLYVGNNSNATVPLLPLQTFDGSAAAWSGTPGAFVPYGTPSFLLSDADSVAFTGSHVLVRDAVAGIYSYDVNSQNIQTYMPGVATTTAAIKMDFRISDGSLFITSPSGSGDIDRYQNGVYAQTYTTPVTGKKWIAVDELTGDAYVTSNVGVGTPTDIYRISTGGTVSLFTTLLNLKVLAIEVDPVTRRLLLGTEPFGPPAQPGSQEGAIYSLTLDTAELSFVADGFGAVVGIALDEAGRGVYALGLSGGGPVPDTSTLYWLPLLAGTSEDVTLAVGANGPALTADVGRDLLELAPGDAWSIHVDSPGGSLYNQYYVLVTQLMPLGALPYDPSGFANVYVNGAGGLIIGQGGLLAGGASLSVPVPAGLAGLQLVNQAFVLTPGAQNNIFAASEGRIVRFVP